MKIRLGSGFWLPVGPSVGSSNAVEVVLNHASSLTLWLRQPHGANTLTAQPELVAADCRHLLTGGLDRRAVRSPIYAVRVTVSLAERPPSGDLRTGRASVATNSPTAAVLSVGYLVLDVVTTPGGFGKSAGGTAGNVAANLAWLGRRAGLLARIGNDHAGDLLCRDLVSAGVDTTHVHRSPEVETPVLIQQVGAAGPKYLFQCPVCKRKFASHRPATSEQAAAAAESEPDILFVDRASRASLELMDRVRSNGGLVMFEPNGPGRAGLTAQAINKAHILKVSSDRVASLGALLDETPAGQVQVRTYGARGLEFKIGGGAWHFRRALPIRVHDSAGAGDWVSAALLAQLVEAPELTYRSLNEALKFGQTLASASCLFPGARGMNTCTTWEQFALVLDGINEFEHSAWTYVSESHAQVYPSGCAACAKD